MKGDWIGTKNKFAHVLGLLYEYDNERAAECWRWHWWWYIVHTHITPFYKYSKMSHQPFLSFLSF